MRFPRICIFVISMLRHVVLLTNCSWAGDFPSKLLSSCQAEEGLTHGGGGQSAPKRATPPDDPNPLHTNCANCRQPAHQAAHAERTSKTSHKKHRRRDRSKSCALDSTQDDESDASSQAKPASVSVCPNQRSKIQIRRPDDATRDWLSWLESDPSADRRADIVVVVARSVRLSAKPNARKCLRARAREAKRTAGRVRPTGVRCLCERSTSSTTRLREKPKNTDVAGRKIAKKKYANLFGKTGERGCFGGGPTLGCARADRSTVVSPYELRF